MVCHSEVFLSKLQYFSEVQINIYYVNAQVHFSFFKESGLYEYKILGELLDIKYETCKAVYMDLEYRKTWDSYVKGLS